MKIFLTELWNAWSIFWMTVNLFKHIRDYWLSQIQIINLKFRGEFGEIFAEIAVPQQVGNEAIYLTLYLSTLQLSITNIYIILDKNVALEPAVISQVTCMRRR